MAILKDLIVHGSSRFLNKIYANELETSAFEAESAIIKKLTAKDATVENATVIGLLDVQGQLHTNTWTNSNIATIDGCFYITPTLSSDSGKISFSSTTVASLTGSYSAVTSLYIGDSSSGSTVQWTKDSKVLLTGEVEVNGQWLPLGTLLGTLSANASTSSIGLTGLTDNRHNPSSIITDIRNAVSNASLNYRNLKISLYQRRDGNDSKPLGIYMTAMGTNGKTFIDIYGGVNSTTTAGSSGGFADPNLRIGNLSGLGAVEGTTPTGWGIYTTNGYFKGVIVSSAGKIGNFTINSALYSNNHSAWNSNVSGIYINNDGISGGAGGKWWLWNDGSAKIGEMTLSAAGSLTVPAASVNGELTAATINGSKITANSITAGQIAASAITADELAANAVTSAKIKAGEVKATNIAADAVTAEKISVENLSAISASMGTLTSGTISYGTVGSNSSFYLSSSDTSATIAGASRTGLRLTVGPNFGVSNTGVLYASSATISGAINATSLSTGTKTASTTGKGTFINSDGAIYVGNGSTNNFTVTDTGIITATGANLLTATIGNATNKITIGTGTSGHSSIRYGMTTLADTSNNGFYIGTDGIALGKGAFKVTAAGALTATSGSISGGIVTSGIDASNITVGTLGADRIGAGSIAIGKLDTSTQTKINNVVKQSIETIIGTQTSNTYTWTGTSSTLTTNDLVDGLTINYFLPYSVGGSQVSATYKRLSDNANINTSGAVLNLTFSDGTSTGNLPIWYQGVGRLTSHYGYGSIIKMTYYENIRMANAYEATGWWVDAQYNSDTYDNRIIYFTGKTGTKGIWAGSLFMEDASGTYQGICCASDGTITSASSGNGARTTATTKIANTNGFKVGSTIYYTNTSYNANTSISGYAVVYSNMGNVFDSRYCMNTTLTANSLTTYKPWYLVGSINSSDGLFYLDSTWWTQTPNVTGKVYILGGGVYDSTTSNCRITLYEDNVWYVYNGSSLVPYEKYVSDQAAKTATSYITYVNATDGIKVHNASDTTNYLQLNSSAISMYKSGIRTFNTDNNGYVTIGKVDTNKRNVYITDNAVQIRNNTSVLAEYGSSIKLYKPGTTTAAVEISNTGATFTGGIVATSLTLGTGVTIGYSSISNPPTIPTTVAQLTDSGSYLTTTVAANTYATQTAATNAAKTASKYITAIDQNGIKVHAENNSNLNYTKISSQAIIMYQNGNDVMNLKTNQFRIGTNTGNNIKIDTNGITINNGSTQVASYKDSIILGDEANNNLLFLDKSSLSLRSGVEDYLSGNEVFEVGECAETISKTVTSGQASYQWSELTNNTKELKEVTLSEVLLEEGVDYTFNSTTGTITLTNAPTNSTSKLKVSFIPINPEAIQKTITFTTPEEEYWLLRSHYTIPQHVTNIFSVSLNGTVLTSSQYSYDSSTHILKIPATPTESNAPAAGSTIEVVYTKSLGYYYTLGKRDLTKIGDYSIATGYNCMAAGDKSFAGGNYTYVTGQSSFGYGYGTNDADCVQVPGNYCGGIGRGIIVRGTGNFGCGNYNVPSSSYIFSVGNGSSSTDRKNAFYVAKSGNTRVAGNLSVMNGLQIAGQIRQFKTDGSGTVPLFWYDTKRKSNISVPANNTNTGLTCDITLPNRIPMGIVGMRILNSSSNGANASNCNLYIYMIVHNSSEDHVTFSIKNSASSAAKVDVEFKIFYIANEALNSQIEWT